MANSINNNSSNSYHFIGIGGIGMSALASMLLRQGNKVSGSDIASSPTIDDLIKKGAIINIGHSSENINGEPVIVYSSAISENNPEIIEARKRGLQIIQRAELLSRFFNIKKGIAIAGTHGKTTTTTLMTLILKHAEFSPDAFIGGDVTLLNGNIVHGGGDYVVAEADESDGSLLNLKPLYSIITNIEGEHFGYFKDVESIIEVFRKFINQTQNTGAVYLNIDDINTSLLYSEYKNKKIAYSIENSEADIFTSNIRLKSFGSEFTVVFRGRELGKMELNIPGIHNISNSLGVIAIATDIGIDFKIIKEALKDFKGVKRRFELKADIENILIIDDYAHHPSEIAATINSAKSIEGSKRIIGIFQPHRFSRVKYLRKEFAPAFKGLDMLILTDIYSACEKQIEGIDGETILKEVISSGLKNVFYVPDVFDIPEQICDKLYPGDVVIAMGAGNITKISDILAGKLKARIAEVR